jgi:thiopeptide-type bacteriocin biosynthesis protein
MIGRRELSVLLMSTLFHGARQEPHEQGDIWHRVEQLRPLAADTPAVRVSEMTSALQLLMSIDTSSNSPLFKPGSVLAFIAPWAAAFDAAGRRLGDAAQEGTLQRGIRDVLAHHVIFAWNRVGLDGRTQSILARAARDTAMSPPNVLPGSSAVDGPN